MFLTIFHLRYIVDENRVYLTDHSNVDRIWQMLLSIIILGADLRVRPTFGYMETFST